MGLLGGTVKMKQRIRKKSLLGDYLGRRNPSPRRKGRGQGGVKMEGREESRNPTNIVKHRQERGEGHVQGNSIFTACSLEGKRHNKQPVIQLNGHRCQAEGEGGGE